MMPLWMNLLGYRFLRGQMVMVASSRGKEGDPLVMHVPYGKIIASLMALIVPLLIGILIAKLKPNVAEKARKVSFFNFVWGAKFFLLFLFCLFHSKSSINFWMENSNYCCLSDW